MHVASLELCRELYELTGWGDNGYWREDILWWYENSLPGQKPDWRVQGLSEAAKIGVIRFPAYDLGYLLRKLPRSLPNHHTSAYLIVKCEEPEGSEKQSWSCSYGLIDDAKHYNYASTPEDAVCKLAIELFRQGILKKELTND